METKKEKKILNKFIKAVTKKNKMQDLGMEEKVSKLKKVIVEQVDKLMAIKGIK